MVTLKDFPGSSVCPSQPNPLPSNARETTPFLLPVRIAPFDKADFAPSTLDPGPERLNPRTSSRHLPLPTRATRQRGGWVFMEPMHRVQSRSIRGIDLLLLALSLALSLFLSLYLSLSLFPRSSLSHPILRIFGQSFVLPAAHWQAFARTINLFLETDLLGSLSVLGSATPFIFPSFPLLFRPSSPSDLHSYV